MGLALCAGMTALTSCNDEVANEGGGGNNEPGNETTETGYFSINLQGGIMTRADWGTNEGTDSERRISDVWVGLYDNNTEQLEYSFPLDANNGNTGGQFQGTDVVNDLINGTNTNISAAPSSNASFTMVAQKVLKKPYKMVVLANYNKVIDPALLDKGTPLFLLMESMSRTVDELTLFNLSTPDAERDYIFMSNARGIVPVYEEDLDPDPKVAESVAKAVPVAIDRAVAKVNVVFKASGPDVIGEGASIDIPNAKWNVDIVNRHLYPLRKQTYAHVNEYTTEFESLARVLPATLRYNLYAEDPNFEDVSIQLNPMLPNRLDYNFERITDPDDINKTLAIRNPLLPNEQPFDMYAYVTENTMKAEEQWEDVTTRVVVKLNYIPKNMSAGESYFYFSDNKTFYTVDDLLGDPDLLPRPLAAILEDIQTNHYYEYQIGGPESWTYRNLTYYSQGISYYSILIRHFDNDQQPNFMQYGRYGVVRNNVYNITVNSIKKPGSIHIPEPEGPDDKEGLEEYISANIEVQPWYIRNQGAELE